jgi:hypothetical protein
MTRRKSIQTRLDAFRQETGMDVEAFVAAWREGSIERTPENEERARRAEALWEELKSVEPEQPPNDAAAHARISGS